MQSTNVLKLFTLLFTVLLLAAIVSCEETVEDPNESILPDRFGVDVPNSISDANANSATNGRVGGDELGGDNIYKLLSVYIAIGEQSSDVLEQIIAGIASLGINSEVSFSYVSDEDGRTKNLQVIEGPTYHETTYEFKLTITDVESEGNADGGKAIQIFWNRSPVTGVAILKPYNINRKDHDSRMSEALYMIEYAEQSNLGYDAHMIVTLGNLPLADPTVDPYSISTLKMFVGKSGDMVDVYGNSDHPNARFFTQDTGFNWAFVASGSESTEIAVAEVGLPPNNLDETSRTVLLEDYAIQRVFETQIKAVWPAIDQSTLDQYLGDSEAPGFFSKDGFRQGGTSPGAEYGSFATRIKDLTPYNPTVIASLEISFQ